MLLIEEKKMMIVMMTMETMETITMETITMEMITMMTTVSIQEMLWGRLLG